MKIKLDPGAICPTRAHEYDYKSDFLNMTCPVCGKRFHLKNSAVKRAKNHYCSKKCLYISKQTTMKGENNHQYGLKGQKNSSWKSDKKITKYGYISVRSLDHPFRDKADMVLEHRLVAEKYLLNNKNSIIVDGEKYLSPEYVVHHKNFDRTDNRPENLIVMTKSEHQSLHAKLNKRKRDKKGMFVKEQDSIFAKRVTETAIVPERKTDGAAGYDMFADIQEPVIINPGEVKTIYSGIAFSIPKNFVGLIYARSGLALKMGLRPATCVSVIDSDYRGNIAIPLYNDSQKPQTIMPKERIAQILFQKTLILPIEIVDELDATERGNNGFGSTGR